MFGPIHIGRVKWVSDVKRVEGVNVGVHSVEAFLRHVDVFTAGLLHILFREVEVFVDVFFFRGL